MSINAQSLYDKDAFEMDQRLGDNDEPTEGALPQAKETLHPGGWKRFVRFPRLYDAWLVLTGQFSLHRAWQSGYDQHIMDNSARRANGGR